MVKNKTKSRIALSIALIFLITAAVVAYLFFDMTNKANPDPDPNNTAPAEESLFPYVDWDYWQSINPDIIGWVTVPGTNIDYPIMQAHADDPDYYLHHDIYGNWSVYGVPYLDAECEETGLFNSPNGVVFGHHMNDDSMFADFANYSDSNYAQEHQMILVQDPDHQIIYYPRCAEIINANELTKRTSFNDDEDYRNWYADIIDNAVMVLDSTTEPDSLITWCTCSYNYFGNERTLVYSSAQEVYWQSEESLEKERQEALEQVQAALEETSQGSTDTTTTSTTSITEE